MKRSSKAHWTGDLKTGHGQLTTQSQVLNKTQYSFNTRFADGIGTNPEELLAAAHAGCFNMALTYALSQLKFSVKELETTAVVTVELEKGGITQVELALNAEPIAGLSEEEFIKHANEAKQNCLISRALGSVNVNLTINYYQFQSI